LAPVLHWRYVTLRRLAIAAILAVIVGASVAEMFDQWDHSYQDGNDTEANVAIVALCFGVALSIAGVAVARIQALSSASRAYRFICRPVHITASVLCRPIPTSSPPTPLRV
jgi:hypothetical protein